MSTLHKHIMIVFLKNWLPPTDALTSFSNSDIILPPPTWVTLNQLAVHSKIELLAKACKDKSSPAPWLPILASELQPKPTEEGVELVLPGDERYPDETSQKGIIHCMVLSSNNSYKYINGRTILYSKL